MINPGEAQIKAPTADDRLAIERLLRRAELQHSSLVGDELKLLLRAPLGALMWYENRLVALLLAGLGHTPTSWIRAVAFDSRTPAREAMPLLLAELHRSAAAQDVRQIFFIGDSWSSSWFQAHLRSAGYVSCEEVVGYEKREWDVPRTGNADLAVRGIRPADLSTVAELDSAAFEPQWVKPPVMLEEALSSAALFLLAEDRGQPAGYALLTEHYDGRLAHLVRLAVRPEQRGRGIGSRLLADVVAHCRHRRPQALSLNTQASNTPALRLYSSFGFQPTGERQLVLQYHLP